jgi:hypothetical protein
MDGTIRTLEKCPICRSNFNGTPLYCNNCNTSPKKYFIDISWGGKRLKIYTDKDDFVFDS